MGYDVAINKAWSDLANLNPDKGLKVRFLADEYDVDIAAKKLLSLSCNMPAKDFSAILILHYLAQKLKGLPEVTGEWLPFRELSGIEGYYAAFRKRSIEPVIRKYGNNPQGLYSVLERLPSKKTGGADNAIIVEVFEKIPALIKVWKSDDEFGPDANILFDRSIMQIFCIEDIVVLAGIVAGAL